MSMETLLRQGLSSYGLPAEGIPALMEFSRRLLEKNQVMNLTAITDPDDVATLHLLDCAALLTVADFRGKQVVDVGTGSGILALGALKLGAASVVARDLDGAVLSEVEENLDLNGLRGAVRLEEGDLLGGFEGPVDLLTANIILEPLLQLLPDVRRVLRPGGWALFSGLLGTERQVFLEALEHAGLVFAEDQSRGEWWGVAAQNPA